MTYLYLLLAASGGAILGMIITAMLAMSGYEHTYQTGYQHGHADGFNDGVKSIDGVG